MILKIFKAVWFLSVLATLALLLFNYAGLPESVVVQQQGVDAVRISRETFFYLMMAITGIVNFMVFPIAKIYKTNEDFRSWFYGLVIALNFFFIVSMNFVALFNSGEKYDYSRINIIIYGSVGLFVLWMIGWPVYLLFRKVSGRVA